MHCIRLQLPRYQARLLRDPDTCAFANGADSVETRSNGVNSKLAARRDHVEELNQVRAATSAQGRGAKQGPNKWNIPMMYQGLRENQEVWVCQGLRMYPLCSDAPSRSSPGHA